MSATLLVLRPQPGAARTATRAAEAGWFTVVEPLFDIRPLAWDPPMQGEVDCLLLTSANAVEQAGPGLDRVAYLPAYAVGEATAAAARARGIAPRRIGTGGVEALLPLIRADGHARPLHLSGANRRVPAGIESVHRATFVAQPVGTLPADAAEALAAGAIALVHSPQAGLLFAALVDGAGLGRAIVRLVAISGQALAAAGPGWHDARASAAPTDAAMLAAARLLCEDATGIGRERA